MEDQGANEQDRLSALPDELIHRILSSGVNLNEIVKTCTLSKRWLNLWRTFPNLNFTSLRIILASDAKYLNFITKFLLGRSQQVQTCSVHLDMKDINESVGGIVLLILFLSVSHCVDKLQLSFVKLDSCLSFPVLTELSLNQCHVSLTKWSLPCFTTLDIQSLCPRNQEIIYSFNNFQCLNNLTLEGCFGLVSFRNPQFVSIDLPNLETLSILHTSPIQFPECKFVLLTPKLKIFRFLGRYVPVISAEAGFPCLEQVWFNIDVCQGEKINFVPGMYVYKNLELDEYPVNEIMPKFSSLFSAFGKTKVLILSPKTFQVLSRDPNFFKYQSSPFVNLKELHLVGNAPSLPRYDYPSTSTNHVLNYLLTTSPGAKIIPYSPWMPNADGDSDRDLSIIAKINRGFDDLLPSLDVYQIISLLISCFELVLLERLRDLAN